MSTINKRKRLQPWVGTWLREVREESNIGLADVAKKLDRVPSSISRIETGAARIPADDLPVVLRAYGVTTKQFAARSRRSVRLAVAA